MATGSELALQIQDIVLEDQYGEEEILTTLNRCASFLSTKFVLPSLDQQGTVNTSTTGWNVAAPEDFQRNMYYAVDSSGRPLSILDSRKQMLQYCGGNVAQTGSKIERVAVVGSTLLHWPVSVEVEPLTLFYQRKPTEITLGEEVDILPAGYADSDTLFINYACWKLFETIEQGLEGQKVDTNYYMSLFLGMLDDLETYLKHESGVSLPGPRTVRMSRW